MRVKNVHYANILEQAFENCWIKGIPGTLRVIGTGEKAAGNYKINMSILSAILSGAVSRVTWNKRPERYSSLYSQKYSQRESSDCEDSLFSILSISPGTRLWKSITIYELDYASDFLTSPDRRAIKYYLSLFFFRFVHTASPKVFLAVSLSLASHLGNKNCPCVDAATALLVRIHDIMDLLLLLCKLQCTPAKENFPNYFKLQFRAICLITASSAFVSLCLSSCCHPRRHTFQLLPLCRPAFSRLCH